MIPDGRYEYFADRAELINCIDRRLIYAVGPTIIAKIASALGLRPFHDVVYVFDGVAYATPFSKEIGVSLY